MSDVITDGNVMPVMPRVSLSLPADGILRESGK